MNDRLKIQHIITGLATGGAETMLHKLLSCLDRGLFSAHVVSLTDKGPTAEKIEALGVHVQALGMRRGIPDPRGIWRLRRCIQEIGPDIIQTWMYHADLIGGLAARCAGNVPVVWNIRHSNLDARENKKTTLWTAKGCAWFSRQLPTRIVCCSEASRQVHTAIGYDPQKMVVIPNGFDLDMFAPDPAARESVRHELGVGQSTFILGMVARFDPQKDHFSLIQCVRILASQGFDFRIVLCGKGMECENAQLAQWIQEAGLTDRFFLLGPRDDMPRITAALDIAVLSSAHGEGFPNVLGEAMACEVPCVATDVGDSAEIIGDTGVVVPPRDPVALAGAIQQLLEMGAPERVALGKAARLRVQERFELEGVARRYEQVYRNVLK